MMNPPVGLYEPQFNETYKKKVVVPDSDDKYIVYPFLKPYEENNNHVDLRFIHKTYENPPLI